MKYVNRETGEIIKCEEISLNNICNGDLNNYFRVIINDLGDALQAGEESNITIKIKVAKVEALGDTVPCIKVSATINHTLPKVSLNDDKTLLFTDEGVGRPLPAGLFINGGDGGGKAAG